MSASSAALAAATTKVDAMLRHADLTTSEVEAVALLRDHAHATSAPGDLAALAGELRAVIVDDDKIDTHEVALELGAIEKAIRAHRCAREVEVLTAAEVRALPPESWIVPVDESGVPLHDGDGPARPHSSTHFYRGRNAPTPDRHAVVYRAPEPPAPLAVGDEIGPVEAQDPERVPVRTLVVVAGRGPLAQTGVRTGKGEDGWQWSGETGYRRPSDCLRILELPQGGQ